MSSTFESYFESLKNKRIAVFGLGVSNRPLVRLLLEFGCDCVGCDQTPREKLDEEVLELERMGCRLSVGGSYLEGLEADLVFRTPGMHPGNPALEALRQKGAEVTSEMEAFFRLCPSTIVAITGSDGKTTTTRLISEMLKAAGKTVWEGGNIGTPLLPHVREMQETDFCVVELSSFQLLDMQCSPHVAVVTNLSPNHLDVHTDMDEYVEAKKNIFRYQSRGDVLVINADNGITSEFVGTGITKAFSYHGRDAAVKLEGDRIIRGGVPVLDKKDILLPGEHNVENYMAAIAAVEGFVEDDVIRHVAKTFGGVEHRIELVRVKDGIRFYNDSIASSPSRTVAGLRSFPGKVILIAGGYDKNIPYDTLGPEICAHVKKLFLCGTTAPRICAAVEACPGEKPETVDCGRFEAAVRAAAAAAQPGDVVLMSPASASFDEFKNFVARGNFFKKIVLEL